MPVIEEVHDDDSSGTQQRPTGSGDGGGTNAFGRITHFVTSNKIEAMLWLSRLVTIFTTISYFLPVFGGHPYSYYQKAMLSNAVTSALRLHQRVPNFQFSREYFGRLFLEDSAHYLFYSLIFVTGPPVSMALLPVFLFAVLHAQNYTRELLNKIGPNSLQLIRRLVDKIGANQVSMLRFIACSEIFLLPSFIFLILTGQANLLMPFLYYRFISLRYGSLRNPYCRQLFGELRVAIEAMCSNPQCPRIVASICYKMIAFICRMAPVTAATPQ